MASNSSFTGSFRFHMRVFVTIMNMRPRRKIIPDPIPMAIPAITALFLLTLLDDLGVKRT
ncbi:hypothetical protein Sjap_014600 [Stephania japonica]|uniref:Uncharacterized protein n=1 Tax=Stephania japonica TaxID=461633 RepID=A0AAP0IIK8_9MAGN